MITTSQVMLFFCKSSPQLTRPYVVCQLLRNGASSTGRCNTSEAGILTNKRGHSTCEASALKSCLPAVPSLQASTASTFHRTDWFTSANAAATEFRYLRSRVSSCRNASSTLRRRPAVRNVESAAPNSLAAEPVKMLQMAATLQHFSRTLDTTPTAYRRRFSTT
jgi:hypothetical protein